ncbi:MAG: hypothetical protein M3Z13_06100 [Candidatus Dormibacteraeota bacterium]|nr:hypothetical protein [Candidatus Dormibacteraeota bacterium]
MVPRFPIPALLPALLMAAACAPTGQATTGPSAPGAATASNSARPHSSPRPGPLPHRAAAIVILEDGAVPLPRVAARDHVGLTQAAEEQENQPLALTRYRRWGWLDEATRTWVSGERRLSEELIVLTGVPGARHAFLDLASSTGAGVDCAAQLLSEDCLMIVNGQGADLVAQLGPFVFHFRAEHLEASEMTAFAAAQTARLKQP